MMSTSAGAACEVTSSASSAILPTDVGIVYVVAPSYCSTGDLTIECESWDSCPSLCVDYGGAFVESNGIAGLQRHWDQTCGAPYDTDPMMRDQIDYPMDD